MEVMQYLGIFSFFEKEFDVFKVIGKEIYYYENLKTGNIYRVELR